MSRLRRHPENHLVERIGWLRAAVLGANDGIVSTASLIVGVAAAAATRNDVLIAGVAGLVSSREVWRNGATERILRFNRPIGSAEVFARSPWLLEISARQNPAENVGLGRTGGPRRTEIQHSPHCGKLTARRDERAQEPSGEGAIASPGQRGRPLG